MDKAPSRPNSLGIVALAGGSIVLVAFLLQLTIYWAQLNDDAFITFRYSHNLASGLGPYYNPGEKVEGFTNPLLMLICTVWLKVFGASSIVAVAKLLGVLSAALTVAMAAWGAWKFYPAAPSRRRGEREIAAVLAGAVVAMTPNFAVNSTTGLETSLTGALLTAGTLAMALTLATGRWRGAGIFWGLAIWCRPEVPVPFAACWLAMAVALLARRDRPFPKALIADGFLAAAALGLLFGLRWLIYHEIFPNTYYAKVGGYSNITPSVYVDRGLVVPLLGVFGILVGTVGVLAFLRRTALPALLLLVGLAGGLLPFATGSDWMVGYRLIVPYLALASIGVGCGWAWTISRLTNSPILRNTALLGTLTLLWMLPSSARWQMAEYVALRNRGFQTGHGGVAKYLAAHLQPGDAAAMMDIGIVGFENPGLRIIDISGLTDHHIAHSPGRFLQKDYDPAYVLDQKPRHIVLIVAKPGVSYTVPDTLEEFQPLTGVEQRFLESPNFQKHYRRKSAPPPQTWLDVLAAKWGAVAAFEHGFLGSYFILLVYERTDAAPAPGGT